MLTICCICHKTKKKHGWVKQLVPGSKNLSHGYCPQCFQQAMKKLEHHAASRVSRNRG